MLSQDLEPILQCLSTILGFLYTLAWSLSFYPQILLNIKRRSTIGATASFPILNVLGFVCYSASIAAFLFSETIQDQYRHRHNGSENTTRGNDLVFATHALVLSVITLSQYSARLWGFSNRWRVGKAIWLIVGGSFVAVLVVVLTVYLDGNTTWQWLDVVYTVGYIKLFVTLVKYTPQAYFNYKRKSTVGWSIYPMVLDFIGGSLSIAQLVLDSGLQRDWSGITGNPVKFGLGNVSIAFDVVFLVQHYLLYEAHARVDSSDVEREGLLANDERVAHV